MTSRMYDIAGYVFICKMIYLYLSSSLLCSVWCDPYLCHTLRDHYSEPYMLWYMFVRSRCLKAETTSAFVFRSVNMEGLMERLERAVTRLEKFSVSMQESSGVANRGCVNGVNGGKSPFRNEKRSRENRIPLRISFESRCKFVPVCVKICPRRWRRSTSSWTAPWRSTWRSAKPSEMRWRNM